MQIVTIVGARPQFVKLAPFSRAIRGVFEERVIHTGQHYDDDMSANFFRDLEIPRPDFNLNSGTGTHGFQTGKMIAGIEEILMSEKPDAVVVFGDTNSTLAGAIASTKLNIKTFHIEAGLRSFNRTMPEEINRILTDHASDFLFAPTLRAMHNLNNEGLTGKSFLTGDIMVDSIQFALDRLQHIQDKSEYIFLTLHRPYNVDSPKRLKKILSVIEGLELQTVFPVHPRTKKMLIDNSIHVPENIKLREPCGYLESISLQKYSKFVITDSGGVQKEAYILKKPCFTYRPETEWEETVISGWNLLINPSFSADDIRSTIIDFKMPTSHENLFGADVAKNMVQLITNLLNLD